MSQTLTAPRPLVHPNASYSLTIRVSTPIAPGQVGRVATTIGQEGGEIGAIDIVAVSDGRRLRDFTVACRDELHGDAIVQHLRQLAGVEVVDVADRTFQAHQQGKISIVPRVAVKTRDDLSMIYTPGVARVCMAIAAEPAKQWAMTIKPHTIAVVSDGTAVLGLGDIGPAGAQPVMEGKAMIFKEFGGLDAFPICLATRDPDEIVDVVKAIAPVFGGINLEDIAAPKCFLIEERLRRELDIPVMHDDQHGTAVVVLAALKNALKVVGKRVEDVKIVIAGAGAAGVATAKLVALYGARLIVVTDRAGAIYAGREEHMNSSKAQLADATNPHGERGSLRDVLRGADVFIGLSGPGLVSADDIAMMGSDPIVFGLANPVPEVQPEELVGIASVVATGRSDYPNQINNSLAFPGIFRGALEVQATDINEQMKLAAANAIADLIVPEEMDEEHIIPSMFDRRVADVVAQATRAAAITTGVARRIVQS